MILPPYLRFFLRDARREFLLRRLGRERIPLSLCDFAVTLECTCTLLGLFAARLCARMVRSCEPILTTVKREVGLFEMSDFMMVECGVMNSIVFDMCNKKDENTSHYVLTIQNLDDDCLLHIFSFLSIIDRVKVQRETCPNIRSINVGRPCTESTVEYIAKNFNKLTHFAIQGVNYKYEDYLSILFSNNRNLRYLSMINCCLTNKCLLNLKSESVEELSLDDCSVGMLEEVLSSLEQLKKLCSLKFVCCYSDKAPWITSTLSTISSNLTNLKKLDIYLYDCTYEWIEGSCIDQLKNLEILYIGGNVMATDEIINTISNNCRKLSNVQIYTSGNITDAGLSSIASLPNLQYLSVRSLEHITDNFFMIMFKLITLECRRCPNIKNDGISKLILASNHLKMIKINCCASISALGFVDSVIASRNDKLTVEIDSSEIEDNFVSNYCSITKCGDSIVRKIKKLCCKCFKYPNPRKVGQTSFAHDDVLKVFTERYIKSRRYSFLIRWRLTIDYYVLELRVVGILEDRACRVYDFQKVGNQSRSKVREYKVDQMDNVDNFNNLIINDLNDDCLIHIFTLLSMPDRKRIERAQLSWRGMKQIILHVDFHLGLEDIYVEDENEVTNAHVEVLQKALRLCGPYLHSIDFEYDCIKSSEIVISNIHTLCPKVKKIQVGPNCDFST
ncbi:hypothetical protein TSAR_002754, partial [Trichomalopsis sarcophagae]